MYILSCCIKLANFNKYSSLLKPLMLKFCQSEPVKVLVDGQMNPFFRSIKCIVVFHGKRDVATTPVSRTEFHRGYHIRISFMGK